MRFIKPTGVVPSRSLKNSKKTGGGNETITAKSTTHDDADSAFSDDKLGSVVFQLDSFGVAEHVAILTDNDGDKLWVTHAVSGKYQRVMPSILMVDGKYEILTPRDDEYRKNILKLARHWGTCRTRRGKFVTRYDKNRLKIINDILDDFPLDIPKRKDDNLKEHKKAASKDFQESFFSVIKYCARRESSMTRTDSGAGTRCAHFVMVVLQSAFPDLQQCVSVLEGEEWVSDKSIDSEAHTLQKLSDHEKELYENFIEYQTFIRHGKCRVIGDNEKRSIDFWQSDYKEFKKMRDNFQLPYRAKYVSPGLLQDILNDTKNTDWLPALSYTYDSSKIVKSEQEKQAWKQLSILQEAGVYADPHQSGRTSPLLDSFKKMSEEKQDNFAFLG